MKFGIIGNITKPAIKEVLENLLYYLKSKQIDFVVDKELAHWFKNAGGTFNIEEKSKLPEKELRNHCNILIALGGDGTMLHAARVIGKYGIPILGVNLGKLGFLAEISIDELHECIDDIENDNIFIDERLAVQVNASGDGNIYYALNDIVLDRGASARVINIETIVDNDYLATYVADGIILSTPTGSTAYSLSTGGPIVIPNSEVLVINPISPHTLSARPVIVPARSVIKVKILEHNQPVHLMVDGQEEYFYQTPSEFILQKAPFKIKLVKRKGRNYFDLLRTKLMWGKDVRRENA